MMDTLITILGGDRYTEAAYCLANDRVILTLYLASKIMLATAATVIGVVLYIYRDQPARFIVNYRVLFSVCAFLVALWQVTGAVTLFAPVYRIDLLFFGALTAAAVALAAMLASATIRQRS